MPFMFPIFLYSAPSGLTLYICASTLAGIVDSYIVRKHVREPVPAPSTVNAKVPPDLDEFVRRSTAKQPAQRFQTCREIEEFLSRAEPKPLNLKTARAKTLTLIYDGIEEDKVNALVQRVLTEAKTIPSIHVGVMETKQFH